MHASSGHCIYGAQLQDYVGFSVFCLTSRYNFGEYEEISPLDSRVNPKTATFITSVVFLLFINQILQ